MEQSEAQSSSCTGSDTNLPLNAQELRLSEHSSGLAPLVTFVIYAYNEEKYIKAAIEGAFAQDYSPLEIILSDDGSSDKTFEIMQEMVASYNGPHRVLLNRNACNIGIGSQLTACFLKSKGDLILLANGDDISLPERTRVVVDAWLDSDRKTHAVYADLEEMDENGKTKGTIRYTSASFQSLEEAVRRRFSGGALAASLAISRAVFERFGPLPDNLILEDNPLHMRAMLLGSCLHLDRRLVRYRVHSENMSQAYEYAHYSEWIQRLQSRSLWQAREGVKAYLQMLRDLYQLPADPWPARDLTRSRWAGMEKLLENAIVHDFYVADRSVSFIERWKTLVRLCWVLTKVWLKTVFPFIERRNQRWHHRSMSRRYLNPK